MENAKAPGRVRDMEAPVTTSRQKSRRVHRANIIRAHVLCILRRAQ